jgi:hypothetical protein
MPKKMVAGPTNTGGDFGVAALPTWQAAGLSLAVVVLHVLNGSGALVFGLLSVGVIWTLQRLHTHAPHARTTADLIASVPGAAPARAISVIQFVAYVLIGAFTAAGIASIALVWISGPNVVVPGWSGPALSVAAVAVAAVLVGALPTRLLAPVATVLAAVGLLVIFYVSLAVIARVASGTAPITPTMEIGPTAASAEWGPAALMISLAIGFAVFEIPTAVNARLTSVARPLGLAIGLVVLCAAVAWLAANMGSTGEFHYSAADLFQISTEMFGDLGGFWLLAASISQAVAALLVLVWGATRVVRKPATDSPVPMVVSAVVMGVLALTIMYGWGDADAKLWNVAGILLLVVYVAAAQANSRLDNSSTTAWAVFALMGIVVGVTAFLTGADVGWWPVAIAAVIIVAAAAWAARSEQVSRENRTA